MALSETVKLRRAVLRCGSPWNVEQVDRLIARCDTARKHTTRLDGDGPGLLGLAESFLESPAGTALADRRWWLMRHAALALEARERRRELAVEEGARV